MGYMSSHSKLEFGHCIVEMWIIRGIYKENDLAPRRYGQPASRTPDIRSKAHAYSRLLERHLKEDRITVNVLPS